MKNILFIIHSPSENTERISNAVIDSINREKLNIKINLLKPSEASSKDVIKSDGILIGTTENLASIAGATKDFFDRTYYDLIDKTEGMPIAVWIRAGHDGTGSLKQFKSIISGLRWKLVQEILVCKGPWKEEFVDECIEMTLGFVYGIESNVF